MSTDSPKTIDRRLTTAQNTLDRDALASIVATDVVGHYTGFPEVRGFDSYLQLEQLAHTVFPDFTLTIDDQIAEDDKVATRWTARGTHLGSLAGETPTHAAITFHGTRVIRVADGRVVEIWDVPDQLGLMQQLGIVPRLGSPDVP